MRRLVVLVRQPPLMRVTIACPSRWRAVGPEYTLALTIIVPWSVTLYTSRPSRRLSLSLVLYFGIDDANGISYSPFVAPLRAGNSQQRWFLWVSLLSNAGATLALKDLRM